MKAAASGQGCWPFDRITRFATFIRMNLSYSNRLSLNLLVGLVLLLVGASHQLRAQAPTYTPAQVERVAKLSELYGHIKFFHPYLGYKTINWDSAFAQAAPAVARATTDAETAAALRQLLAVLGDEASAVKVSGIKTAALPTTAADSMQVFLTADSTLVLKTNGYAGTADYAIPIKKLGGFVAQLPKAKAVLLDLRGRRALTDDERDFFRYALSYVGVERLFSTQVLPTAGLRMRNHSGFAPESGGTSGGYWSGYYTIAGQPVQPRQSARNRPLAILVNENAVLTQGLYALRTQPHVRLYTTAQLTDAQLAPTVKFPFSETISVEFRTGELVNPDGSTGLAGIATLPPTLKPEATQAYVLAQLRAPRPATIALAMGNALAAPTAPVAATYPPGNYPALGYRLLAGAKMWSIIHYFHAYKDLIPTDWNADLRTAIGELAAAPDSTGYALAVAHFYRHIQDGHGAITASPLRYYVGSGGAPVNIKFIDDKAVITRVYADSLVAKGLHVGDIITEINGEPIATRLARISAIQPASNEWTRRQYMSYRLLRSPVGTPIRVKLLGADNRLKTVTFISQPGSRLTPPADTSAVFRLLPGNLGYADLGRLETKDVGRMFEAFKQTKAIIFDMRGYPNGTAWVIAPRLTNKLNVAGARFFRYAPSEPDFPTGESSTSTQKYFFDQRLPASSDKPTYTGKTVMLIDERTQSQAEHTGLFFEAANGTEFIGSPTAGANGDVTSFAVPGGIRLAFSGHDVRHADGRQLQQVGLQPKIAVRPTVKGIRQGQDEVLARAIKYLNTTK